MGDALESRGAGVTRGYAPARVWTWHCDFCPHTSGDLAYHQWQLPKPDEMRAKGWFIAELFGDKCPNCNKKGTK